MSLDEKALQQIAAADIEQLIRKDAEYGSSWKARGGQGAFFQGIARKWDRLENQVKAYGYDLFVAIRADQRPEGILDDIADLRRYCLLLEAEVRTWPRPQVVGDMAKAPIDEPIRLVPRHERHEPRGYDPEQDNRRGSFNVGNGPVHEGDRVEHLIGARGVVLTIFQDGEAEVRWDIPGNAPPATVKWREIRALPATADRKENCNVQL